MDASDWVASAIAIAALVVSILAVGISWRSAKAAEESAEASESSADTAARQHATELARDGIVEFGPWRAESHDMLNWRFINCSSDSLFDLHVKGGDYVWDISGGRQVAPQDSADVQMSAGAAGPSRHRVTVTWREESEDGPVSTEVAWLTRRVRR